MVSVPSQAAPLGQAGLPAYPAGAVVQVPSAVAPSEWAHTSHVAAHAASQQKPSDAKPVRHWVGLVDGWLVSSKQAPLALHELVAPLHALVQHVLPAHTPETQSPPVAHALPAAVRANSSALERVVPVLSAPPVTSTLPDGRSVAVCPSRGVVIVLVLEKTLIPSKSSALDSDTLLTPPATSTWPDARSVAV